MEPKKVQEKNGKVFETTGATVEPGYVLHPSYDLVTLGPTRIGGTGYLKVIEWKPRVPGLYCFVGRWDEGQGSLDIDMEEIVAAAVNRLPSWPPAYSGHHPKRLPGGSRRFDVEIKMPGQQGKPTITVFRGVVDFGVVREVGLKAGLPLSTGVRVEAEVSRAQHPDSEDDNEERTAPA